MLLITLYSLLGRSNLVLLIKTLLKRVLLLHRRMSMSMCDVTGGEAGALQLDLQLSLHRQQMTQSWWVGGLGDSIKIHLKCFNANMSK